MREFKTGAVRDSADGKGRYDLLPWGAIHALAKHCFGFHLDELVFERRTTCVDYLYFHILLLSFDLPERR